MSSGFPPSFANQGVAPRRSTISRMTNLQRKSTIMKKEDDYFLDTIRAKGFAKVGAALRCTHIF